MHDQMYRVALCGIASQSILQSHLNGRFGPPINQSIGRNTVPPDRKFEQDRVVYHGPFGVAT